MTASQRLIDGDLARVLGHLDGSTLAGQHLFVTGGTGFYGFWLLSALDWLNRAGVPVSACVLSRAPERFLERHARFRHQDWLSFCVGDVTDYQPPHGRFDLFVHAATDTSTGAHDDRLRLFDSIVGGSRRVLEHAVRCGARRILLASSGAVYGAFPPGVERMPERAAAGCDPLAPASAYAEGKRAMETLGALFLQQHGLEPVIARGFAFVGPGLALDGHFAISNFIRDALAGNSIRVNGDGSPLRSYLYGADLAAWLLTLLTCGRAGVAYNLGSDQAVSILELARLVRDLLRPGGEVQVLGQPADNPVRNVYMPDIERARSELGLAPWTSLADAILASADYQRCLNEGNP